MHQVTVEPDVSISKKPSDYPHGFLSVVCYNCNTHLAIPKRCKSRFCEFCQKVRSRRVRRRLMSMVKRFQNANGFTWKKIELTLRSQPDLDSMLFDLVVSFRRLRQRKWWKKLVRGGAYVIEVTYNPENGWHAHVHAILFCKYLPQAVLSRIWNRCSHGSPIVYVRALNNQRHAVNYITKYISTPHQIDDAYQPIADEALMQKRLFNCFGECHDMDRQYKAPKIAMKCPVCQCDHKFNYYTGPNGHESAEIMHGPVTIFL